VAADEARHYSIWADRLQELGSSYGALPVHNGTSLTLKQAGLIQRKLICLVYNDSGLWGSATQTSNDICARLAIVHMVHEARGLDVTPQTISRFQQHGDPRSAELLAAIYEDEVCTDWQTLPESEHGIESLIVVVSFVRSHMSLQA